MNHDVKMIDIKKKYCDSECECMVKLSHVNDYLRCFLSSVQNLTDEGFINNNNDWMIIITPCS